jgi:hypothetical protein
MFLFSENAMPKPIHPVHSDVIIVLLNFLDVRLLIDDLVEISDNSSRSFIHQ